MPLRCSTRKGKASSKLICKSPLLSDSVLLSLEPQMMSKLG